MKKMGWIGYLILESSRLVYIIYAINCVFCAQTYICLMSAELRTIYFKSKLIRWTYTAILQWLEHLWNRENMSETGGSSSQ